MDFLLFLIFVALIVGAVYLFFAKKTPPDVGAIVSEVNVAASNTVTVIKNATSAVVESVKTDIGNLTQDLSKKKD